MDSKRGYIYSVKKNKDDVGVFLKGLFPDVSWVFVENPENPEEFGDSKFNDSINFSGTAFDSKKEARWTIKGDSFFITIISDNSIDGLPEVNGKWERRKFAENEKISGIFLVNSKEPHLDIKSNSLEKYLNSANILENAEVFFMNSIPIFVTMRS